MKLSVIIFSFIFMANISASEDSSALVLECNEKTISYARWYGENINELSFKNLLSDGPRFNLNQGDTPIILQNIDDKSNLIFTRIRKYTTLLSWTYSLDASIWISPIIAFNSAKNLKFVRNTMIMTPNLNSTEFIPENCKVSVIAKMSYLDGENQNMEEQNKFIINQDLWEKLNKLDKTLVLASLAFSKTMNSYSSNPYTSSFYQSRRFFTAIMMSDQFIKMSADELENIVNSLDEGY